MPKPPHDHDVSRRRFLGTAGASGVLAPAGLAPAMGAQPQPASAFRPTGKPRQLSPNLYLIEDTCNVYLVKDGSRGLLIDFGSGRMLELAAGLGVTRLDWVLHTHHHRDQAQGDLRAAAQKIPIAVPAHERYLFEDAENFWRNRRVYHLYNMRNDFYTLTRDVPVARSLHDYETFRWGPYEFFVLPTPGHTLGSITLVAAIDGKRVAFTGDLIHSPGKVQTLYDLQVTYGGQQGVDLSVFSLARLAERKPELVCPSHGEPFADPLAGIEQLRAKLAAWYKFWFAGDLTADNQPIAISPHLVSHSQTNSAFHAILSDSGKAMFIDYGSASGVFFSSFLTATDTFDRIRFVEHSLDVLRARHGMKSVDVAMPSHMHDDHMNGFPHLARVHGTKIWCLDNMVDIFQNPRGRNVGCTLGEPLKVDRAFRHQENFRWEEFEFTVVHSPGHTNFQMAMFVTIDKNRVAFTGDAIFGNPGNPDGSIRHNLIYRNDVLSGDHLKSLRGILDFEPNLIAPGHGRPYPVTRPDLLRLEARLNKQEEHFRDLVADEDTDFGIDPMWVHIYPYQMLATPGESTRAEVRVRNHRRRPIPLEVSLVVPEGWSVEPRVARLEAPAKGQAKGEFRVRVPAGIRGRQRVAIAADVVAGGKYLGQITEAVVDVRSPA